MKSTICVVIFLSLAQLKFAFSQTVVTCSCDLTGSFCDANCCCDPDCSPADVSVFVCSTDTLNADSQLCVNELVYVNNLPSTVVQNNNGLFCIIRQSDTSNNFYTEPTILNSTSDFESAAQQYPTYSYDIETETATNSTIVYYQTGDTIGIQYANGLQSTLGLPSVGMSNACIGSNPAAFMVDQTSTCGRFTLSAICAANSSLDASSYYSPDLFQIATLPFINSVTTGSLINITLCNGTSTPNSPSYDNDTCSNAVSAVSYTINYSGTNGITAACVSVTVSNVATPNMVQTFSINFVADSISTATPVSRSGNPGYVVGRPLRTALQTGTSNNRTLSTDVLTLVTPNTDGTCPSVSTRQIAFGEDVRTGCILRFASSQTCLALYNTTYTLLNEPVTAVVVANYGQTALNSTTANDWLSLSRNETFPNAPASTTTSVSDAGGCAGMLVGINYNIFYANTGSLSNPQPEIIGISYSRTTKTVKYECFGSDCVSNAKEDSLEISSTVTFTDASSSPSSILRQRPTVDARLPSDFFFPFTGTST